MEFALSEEQVELASTLRTLLAKRADSGAVRAAAESGDGYDRALWELLCEQIGAAALAVPEEHDGAGFSVFETLVVLDELGRSLAPSPLLASLVTSEALLASGDADACARLLPRIAAGEVATLAWAGVRGPGRTEPVHADGDTLTGTVTDVLFGDSAEVLLVAARTDDGVALFEVDPAAAGLTRTHTPAMDTTQRLATLVLDGCPATLVAADATGALARAHLVGTVGVAALQVGCGQRALDMTVAYSKERVQFGRPIGSFQALKHRMADMLVLVETSRSISWAAAYAVSVGNDDAVRLAASAGSYCSDALSQIASDTVQLHGGIAITWEHDAQMVFKRAHALGQLFGQAHEHRRAVLA
ncbi:Acyl-CoA dehydrogenase [Nocardioides dokdonensis FR1436]|uniref:Acyl-CoA dehydrogenase n=1 Tax=Nocardioides dokdonensis FR1436 TaxID=1300347 RepID=A0A1A9GHY7_9ACTN|nr:acyl-CoA dehydrogenase family protein [Nocardioides dokdonensis]ANH37075.1 Acyl-CoA dehydrogenase [Nocardioides dokdonensis FR1436]